MTQGPAHSEHKHDIVVVVVETGVTLSQEMPQVHCTESNATHYIVKAVGITVSDGTCLILPPKPATPTRWCPQRLTP